MKTKITLLIAVLFIGFNSSFAQNEEDMNLLSIFSEYAKAKLYHKNGKVAAEGKYFLKLKVNLLQRIVNWFLKGKIYLKKCYNLI